MGINIWRLSRFQGLSDTLYLVSIVVFPVFPRSTLQKFVCNEYMYNCIDETGYEIIVMIWIFLILREVQFHPHSNIVSYDELLALNLCEILRFLVYITKVGNCSSVYEYEVECNTIFFDVSITKRYKKIERN